MADCLEMVWEAALQVLVTLRDAVDDEEGATVAEDDGNTAVGGLVETEVCETVFELVTLATAGSSWGGGVGSLTSARAGTVDRRELDSFAPGGESLLFGFLAAGGDAPVVVVLAVEVKGDAMVLAGSGLFAVFSGSEEVVAALDVDDVTVVAFFEVT